MVVIATLVISLMVIIGLIIINIVGKVDIGQKISSIFSDDITNDKYKEDVAVEEIPYEEVYYYPFKDKNNLWGYVDKDFKEVISPKFLEAEVFSNGLGGVRTENGSGYIDKYGNFVIEDKYDFIECFSDGVAIVSEEYNSEEKLIIDIKGNILGKIDGKYSYYSFEGGNAIIYDDDGGEGLINKRGDIILDTDNEIINSPSNGFRLVSKSDGKYFYVDSKGKILGEKSYYYASDFEFGYGIVEDKNYNLSIIDESGEKIKIPSNFNLEGASEEGIIISDKDNYYYGLIDSDGSIIIEPKFYDIDEFSEGLAFARVDTGDFQSKLSAINPKGEVLFELEESSEYYPEIFTKGVSVIRTGEDECGVINSKGEFIIPLLKGDMQLVGNFIIFTEGDVYNSTSKKVYSLSGQLMYEGNKKTYFSSYDDDVIFIEESDTYSKIMLNIKGNKLRVS